MKKEWTFSVWKWTNLGEIPTYSGYKSGNLKKKKYIKKSNLNQQAEYYAIASLCCSL